MRTHNVRAHGRHNMLYSEGKSGTVNTAVLTPPASMEFDTNEYFIVIKSDLEDVQDQLVRVVGKDAFNAFQEKLISEDVDLEDMGITISETEETVQYVESITSALSKLATISVCCSIEGRVYPDELYDGALIQDKNIEDIKVCLELYGAQTNGLSFQFFKSGKPEMGAVLVSLMRDKVALLTEQLIPSTKPGKAKEPVIQQVIEPKSAEYGETLSLF